MQPFISVLLIVMINEVNVSHGILALLRLLDNWAT